MSIMDSKNLNQSETILKCSYCPTIFLKNEEKLEHLTECHNDKAPLNCSFCSKRFWDHTIKRHHLQKYHNDNSKDLSVENKVLEHLADKKRVFIQMKGVKSKEITEMHKVKPRINHSQWVKSTTTKLEVRKLEKSPKLHSDKSAANPLKKCEYCLITVPKHHYSYHIQSCKLYSKFVKKSDNGYQCSICLDKLEARSSIFKHFKKSHSKQYDRIQKTLEKPIEKFPKHSVKEHICESCNNAVKESHYRKHESRF